MEKYPLVERRSIFAALARGKDDGFVVLELLLRFDIFANEREGVEAGKCCSGGQFDCGNYAFITSRWRLGKRPCYAFWEGTDAK
jgi:hypothetical protein